jgi:hypothetical protein
MPFSVGDKLGPYEILAPVDAGGMSESTRPTTRALIVSSPSAISIQSANSFACYPRGHSMYVDKPILHEMFVDIRDFIKDTTPARRPTPSVQL